MRSRPPAGDSPGELGQGRGCRGSDWEPPAATLLRACGNLAELPVPQQVPQSSASSSAPVNALVRAQMGRKSAELRKETPLSYLLTREERVGNRGVGRSSAVPHFRNLCQPLRPCPSSPLGRPEAGISTCALRSTRWRRDHFLNSRMLINEASRVFTQVTQ